MKKLKNLLYVGVFAFAMVLGYMANQTDIVDLVRAQNFNYYSTHRADTSVTSVDTIKEKLVVLEETVLGTDSTDNINIIGRLILATKSITAGTTGAPVGSIVMAGDSLFFHNTKGVWKSLINGG